MNTAKQPNIVFIMTDDHASHAMSCYGSKINSTPNMDRIANEGMLFNNCFCTNSICTPSRAVILTGKHSHLTGVKTLSDCLDSEQQNVAKLLQKSGYQTGIIGKWHLGTAPENNPSGFDSYSVLVTHYGHGEYFNPILRENGVEKRHEGYITDIVGDLSVDFIKNRDKTKPFMLMSHHKAPHRSWEVSEKYKDMFKEDIPHPETYNDDYSNREAPSTEAEMRITSDLNYTDLKIEVPPGQVASDKVPFPDNLEGFTLTPLETGVPVSFKTHAELKNFKYQRYMKDYLRCVACVDDNIGKLLDCLDDEGIAEDTIVIYTSDQGFYLGDHGWFDKRFMYEESLRMPFVIRYPRAIKPGTVSDKMILNLDFAKTFLDFAGMAAPEDMQGYSLKNILENEEAPALRNSMYYRYWMHLADHYVWSHYGVRTMDYKLIYFYGEALGATGAIDEPKDSVWELFDLNKDKNELVNVYNNPEYADIVEDLKKELYRLKEEALDFE